MGSVGGILSELYLRKPLFPGNNHIEQLKLIFHYLGTPSSTEWIKTPDAKRWVETLQQSVPTQPQDFRTVLPGASEAAVRAIVAMLEMDPKRRVSVRQCLESDWLRPMYAATKKAYVVKHGKESVERLDVCERKFDLSGEFEAKINTLFGVRHLMFEELVNFHKNRQRSMRRKK